MGNKLLLAQCYKQMSSKNYVFRDPLKYKEFLERQYPKMKKWYNHGTFDKHTPWPFDYLRTEGIGGSNVSTHFIKNNIDTPTNVIKGNCTVEKLHEELSKEKYSHVGFSVFTNAYSEFIQCTEYIRNRYPNIQIIAGNYGSAYNETEKYVDYRCMGRGVSFIRDLLGEGTDTNYNIGYEPYQIKAIYKNSMVIKDVLLVVTKIGCPNKCDFCATSKFFSGKFSKEIITPEDFHEFVVNYKKEIGDRDFTIHFAEPTAIISHKWWYDLFELFEGEKGDYPIYCATTSRSLKKLDLDRIINSSLRFDTVLVGVESFERNYNKNKNIDLDKLFNKLKNFGIAVFGTYVIGFPNQTKEDIREGVSKFCDLNLSWYELHNLKLSPLTWNEMSGQDKLVEHIPIDFHHMHGFQAFRHDNFRLGYEDLWPLSYELIKFCETEIGPLIANFYEINKNLYKIRTVNQKIYKRNAKLYKAISKEIFPSWKNYFNPSLEQERKYLTKIDF